MEEDEKIYDIQNGTNGILGYRQSCRTALLWIRIAHCPTSILSPIHAPAIKTEMLVKAAYFFQLCAWFGAHELWMRAVSDMEYFQHIRILEQQKEFAGGRPAFLNILDWGFWAARAAMQAGKQIVFQPVFVPSDREFNTEEVLSLVAVFPDLPGNKRDVKR